MPERLPITGDNQAGFGPSVGADDWLAFAIHPSSLIDQCKVNGELLAPGGLVYARGGVPKIEPVRGFATGGNDFGSEVNSPLVLLGWRTCETPIVPRERAPYLDAVMLGIGAGVPAGDKTLTTVWQRVMRVPFAGRRHAAFHLHAEGGTSGTSQVSFLIRGTRYLSRRAGLAVTNNIDPHYDENAGIETYTYQQSTIDSADNSITRHVGGTDSEEEYDELELWLKKISVDVWDGHFFVEVGCYGELGR